MLASLCVYLVSLTPDLNVVGCECGARARLVRRRQAVEKLAAAIVREFPVGTRISRPQGGFVLWIELPSEVDSVQLYEDALKSHINTAPGTLFTSRPLYRQCLRMNCGIPWSDEVADALTLLGQLAHQQSIVPAASV